MLCALCIIIIYLNKLIQFDLLRYEIYCANLIA